MEATLRRLLAAWVSGLGLAGLAGWGLARCQRVEVIGDSMLPALQHGDHLLAVPLLRPRPGDIVVLADPHLAGRDLVKRLAWLGTGGDGQPVAWVEGDNGSASADSRSFGPVARSALVARVVWRYAPPDRAGRVASRRRAGPTIGLA